MAALRAVASEPGKAAELANKWAEVSRSLLRAAYGTTPQDVEAIETLASEAKQRVLQACSLYTSDASDDLHRLILGYPRIL